MVNHIYRILFIGLNRYDRRKDIDKDQMMADLEKRLDERPFSERDLNEQ